MCIFTAPVDVSNTRIFARSSPRAGGRYQVLLYQMKAASEEDFAMILPLPVATDTTESDVHFHNLADWPYFFDHLSHLFPYTIFHNMFLGPFMKGRSGGTLSVVEAGNYIASFVPRLQDFMRLDSRFRLPPATWNQLPQYSDFGFAVFQLTAGKHRPHPMAFEFPRRDCDQLFFPTVHIHDQEVHSLAEFDHSLYCQSTPRPRGWKASFWHPFDHPDILERDEHEQPLLDMKATVYRLRLQGVLANQDTLVAG